MVQIRKQEGHDGPESLTLVNIAICEMKSHVLAFFTPRIHFLNWLQYTRTSIVQTIFSIKIYCQIMNYAIQHKFFLEQGHGLLSLTLKINNTKAQVTIEII